jgi:menaquinone-dependent protoporphyrinogen IX oxidase
MQGIVIYGGKYGATDQYAEWIAETLRIPAFKDTDYKPQNIITNDYIIIGSSVYVGKLVLRDWLRKNLLYLKTKKLFLFIVCGTPAHNIEKLDKLVRDNLPAELHGLCTVFFLPGRMIMKKLSWKHRLILKMGAWLAKSPKEKAAMLTDYNSVHKENITLLIEAVRTMQAGKRNRRPGDAVLTE